jgi:WD40 repeat protein
MGEHVSMTTGFDLAFHPDSRLLAIPSAGNTIQVWDTSSGKKVATLRGHTGRILSVAFSPDGRRLASTSEDKNVMVWDVSTALEKRELQEPLFRCPHEESVIGVAFSPDNQRLASASAETDKPGEVKVWDAADGKWLFSFPGQKLPNRLVHLTFSPNSLWLAAGSENNNVVVWDVTTHEKVCTLPGHTEPVLNVTFSPDGRRLISAGWDRLVKVWDLGDEPRGVLAPRWMLRNFTTGAWGIALSPDGSRLAIGAQTADGNVRVYDMTTGKQLHILRGDYRVISVAFSRDGRRLAAVGHDRVVRLWDMTTGREVLHLDGHDDIIGQVLFSPDGQRLATASADGTVRVWDASPFQNTDPHIRTLGGPDDGEFFGVDFSHVPGSPLLASASADGFIKLWNIQTGQMVRAFRGLHGHQGAALCVAFQPYDEASQSPDGSLLVSGSMDHTVKLWDTSSTGTEVPRLDLTSFKVMVRGVAFRPDGKAFATVSHQTLQLWDVQTGKQIFAQQVDQEHANGVAFSRDSKFLATVGHSGTAMVWDATGEQVSFFQGHKKSVFCVAFHPEEEYLASGGSDRNVKLWDRATGQVICTLREHIDNDSEFTHTDYVFGVAFSPDGKYLATASWKEVIVWDVSKLVKIAGVWDVSNLDKIQKKRTFDRIAGKILWVAFSPDGKHLAAASGYKGRGKIKIWDATLWDESVVPSP